MAAHYRYAKPAAQQLTKVTLPSGRVASETVYDTATDRVKEYTDEDGGTWKIGPPTIYGGDNDLRRSIQVLDPANRPYLYEYDALAGRLLRSGTPLSLETRAEDRPGEPTTPPSPPPPNLHAATLTSLVLHHHPRNSAPSSCCTRSHSIRTYSYTNATSPVTNETALVRYLHSRHSTRKPVLPPPASPATTPTLPASPPIHPRLPRVTPHTI